MDNYEQSIIAHRAVQLERQIIKLHAEQVIDDAAMRTAIYTIQRGAWVARSRRCERHITEREGLEYISYLIPGSSPYQFYTVDPYINDRAACDCKSIQRFAATLKLDGREMVVLACKHVIAALLLDALARHTPAPSLTPEEVMGYG
jgi:hypothetical protein